MARKRARKPARPRKPMPRKPPKVEIPLTIYRRRSKHRREHTEEP